MAVFSSLLAKLPKINESRMSAQGYVLWFCWQSELDPVISQTLQNYGGMFIVSDYEQSAWFFFNKDVFLALARLSVWAQFNPLGVTVQVLQGRLYFGVQGEHFLDIETSIAQQDVYASKKFDIYIHPRLLDKDTVFPGITFTHVEAVQGVLPLDWRSIEADSRLPYTSSQGWYAVMRPLGNPLDPAYQKAWPHMQNGLVEIFKKNKLKFLVHNDYMMVSIENLQVLRTWLQEQLILVGDTKLQEPEHSWPFLSVVVDRKGMNFNTELYKKITLQWDKLSPDVPYMSYRTAYLLGSSFVVNDIRFSDSLNSMDAWCTIALGESAAATPAIPVLMPAQLISGDEECCFFCGINSHKTSECPTRKLPFFEVESTDNATELGLDVINESFRDIERRITQDGLKAYGEILGEEDDAALLLKAIFDINFFSQLRSMPYMWLTRGRDLGKFREDEELAKDDHPCWDLFEKFCKADGVPEVAVLIKSMQEHINRNARDMRLRNLLGFMYVYIHEFSKASAAFKEAATLTAMPALQAWNEYLQARTAEVQGQFMDATNQYTQVLRVLPQWKELIYRKVVCKVKMGFVEQEIINITKLVQEDPTFFNKFLVDPELGRGQLVILTNLQPLWRETQLQAEAELLKLSSLAEKIRAWFPPHHPSHGLLKVRLEDLQALGDVKNYVAFLEVIRRRPQLDTEIEEFIQHQIEILQERYKFYLAELQKIRDEAAWFPFPKLLRDFSNEFNEAANTLNWAFSSNFQEAESFQQAQNKVKGLEDLLRSLRRRLKMLRAMRDGTLFGMTFLKAFIWIEAVGLLLCLVGIPSIVMFGHHAGLGWLRDVLSSQQWEIQKVLVGIVTVLAFCLALLRSTIIFEKQRDKFLEQAKEQRERLQEERLERIRKKKEADAARAAAERRAAESEALRRRFEN